MTIIISEQDHADQLQDLVTTAALQVVDATHFPNALKNCALLTRETRIVNHFLVTIV